MISWVSGGLSVVSLATAAWAGRQTQMLHATFRDTAQNAGVALENLQRQGHSSALLADTTLGAGLALAVTSGYFLYRAAQKQSAVDALAGDNP
jgi:hypothetical protein